jgi:hypothetical protein
VKTEQYFRTRMKSIGRGDGGVSETIAKGHMQCHTNGCGQWYPMLTGYTGTSKVDGRVTFHCSETCSSR